MSVVVVGAGGMLGRAMVERLRGIDHRALSHAECDVGDPQSIAAIRGDVILNCSAYTDVDGAEQNEAEATRVNGNGVANLADHARKMGALLIHFSTDYVFDGHGVRPYPVDAPLAPINAYGRSKAAGELALARCQHLLIRTSWLYAPGSKCFPQTMLRLAGGCKSLRVVDDQRGRPTNAVMLADAALRLLELGARGTYHVSGGGECTWYELARECLRETECRVEPCPSAEYPRPATRPAYSVLDLSKTEALLGPMLDWRAQLRIDLPLLREAATALP